jgi:hypothetical protein
MSDFRENYLKAREVIANELKEKCHFIVTTNEYDCLTIDTSTSSIHLTFIIPDGDEIYISEKGKEWFMGKSFKDFLFEKYPIDAERIETIRQLFQECSRLPFSYETEEIKCSFRTKLNFLQDSFSDKFT